jgi:hypothetical protein
MISRSELLTATTTIAAALAGTTAWSGSGARRTEPCSSVRRGASTGAGGRRIRGLGDV